MIQRAKKSSFVTSGRFEMLLGYSFIAIGLIAVPFVVPAAFQSIHQAVDSGSSSSSIENGW